MNRTLGIVLLVVGAVLLTLGYNASQSLSSDVSELFRGRPNDESIWFLVAGAGAVVAGLVLALVPAGGRRLGYR